MRDITLLSWKVLKNSDINRFEQYYRLMQNLRHTEVCESTVHYFTGKIHTQLIFASKFKREK